MRLDESDIPKIDLSIPAHICDRKASSFPSRAVRFRGVRIVSFDGALSQDFVAVLDVFQRILTASFLDLCRRRSPSDALLEIVAGGRGILIATCMQNGR